MPEAGATAQASGLDWLVAAITAGRRFEGQANVERPRETLIQASPPMTNVLAQRIAMPHCAGLRCQAGMSTTATSFACKRTPPSSAPYLLPRGALSEYSTQDGDRCVPLFVQNQSCSCGVQEKFANCEGFRYMASGRCLMQKHLSLVVICQGLTAVLGDPSLS